MAPAVETLSRRALNRAYLERQMLLRREPISVADAVERLVGMQAQNPHDPYVALWARVEGFRPEELSALIEGHEAVRAVNMMRTTIHLLTARDALRIRPLLKPMLERTWQYSPFRRSLTAAGVDVDEVVAAGREVLADGPVAMSEIGKRLGARWPDADPAALGYAVRSLVPVIQVPPRGLWNRSGAAACEEMERWLGRPVDPSGSLDELVTRYLRAFGPATAKDVQVWSWLTGIREVVERLRPRLRSFRDDRGRELFDVEDGPRPDPATPAPVRFLPEFDNLLLSHDDRTRVIDRVYDSSDWLRGSILVDGFVRGTWKLTATRRERAVVDVNLGGDVGSTDRDDVGAEAHRLLGFLRPGADGDVRVGRLRERAAAPPG